MSVTTLALEQPAPDAEGQSWDWLLPAMLIGVAALGAIGAVGSFTNVAAAAGEHGWDRPWLLPTSVDGGIAFFTGLDFALARDGKKVRWIRWVAWAGIGATIGLNVAGKHGLFEILGHAALPAVFAAAVEAAKATITARSSEGADRIPFVRWVYHPIRSLAMHRFMRSWAVSFADALHYEARRQLALFVDRHGSFAAAPAREREKFRPLADAAGIDIAELEREMTVRRPPPAELASEAVAGPAPDPARRRAPARKARARHLKKTPTPEADPDVVAAVRKACAEMAVSPHDTTRERVLEHLRRDGPAPHASRVGAALRALREETPREP